QRPAPKQHHHHQQFVRHGQSRMRPSAGPMVSLFSPRSTVAATKPADRDRSSMRPADVITIETSDEESDEEFRDAFRSAGRTQLNGGQRPVRHHRQRTARAVEDAHDGDNDDDNDDDDDDDLLYGRRGGDAMYDTYDSGGGYGTGYYTTDLDADLEGFIDDNVRMSTSEDDDDVLRNEHERRARLYERFELQKEKEALLPALRRDHLRFGSPSPSLGSYRKAKSVRSRSRSRSRSHTRSAARRRSVSPRSVSTSHRSGGRMSYSAGNTAPRSGPASGKARLTPSGRSGGGGGRRRPDNGDGSSTSSGGIRRRRRQDNQKQRRQRGSRTAEHEQLRAQQLAFRDEAHNGSTRRKAEVEQGSTAPASKAPAVPSKTA
ncbi:hypothetical protein Vafri_15531, partial [Volvox africanus]